jgi:2-hydroxy-3-keto-5-methylthiopentenyl-1-phosphate phosphatase
MENLRPIIRAIMSNLLGEEDAERIEIISNYADIRSDGHFSVKFRHLERYEQAAPSVHRAN